MPELLQNVFGWVCGQQMAHTWAPGDLPLPCCQRCTGLYTGVFLAALLHLWQRPCLNERFLKAHGLMLLLMVPLGFHWVAQGPALRAASGILFGAAVFTFLWLPLAGPRQNQQRNPPPSTRRKPLAIYVLGLALAILVLPLLAQYGGRWAGWLLGGLCTAGFLALLVIAGFDALVCLNGISRKFLPSAKHERSV